MSSRRDLGQFAPTTAAWLAGNWLVVGLAAVGALAVVGAAGCSGASADAPPLQSAAAGDVATSRVPTAELLGSMSTLMGLPVEPGRVADWAQRIDSGQVRLDRYIDDLVATERFAGEVVPALLFASFVNVRTYYAVPYAFVLKRGPDPQGPLYLRTPCDDAEAITVRPWWDLQSEVKVCPDSYRPSKWKLAPNEHSYRTAMALSCDSQIGSPEMETHSLCGCGPNLIRCLRDDDQYNEFNRSFMDEVKRTTAYVVEHDLPMSTLFTGNATFRDRNVELYYRRQRIGALESDRLKRELADLDTWPQGGKWAPREEVRPGQHAGVLTAPQILHAMPDRRQRQRVYYEVLWCNLRNSFGATTHKVLEINTTGNNFFVHDSWQKLAHTELCMNCHARLDYGTQFFLGFPDSRASIHYIPALQATGTGPLYGRDIQDPRGSAPLTPRDFATLATEQPEFHSCLARHVINYALGERATDDDVRAIETAFEQGGTFKAPMKVALARYAARWSEDARTAGALPAIASSSSGLITTSAAGGGVAVSAALRAKLDQHCSDCHDKAPYSDNPDSSDLPFDFRGSELPRPLVVSMAEQVAFGMMPKDNALDPRAREEVVGLLVDALWRDPAARAEARRYYLGRARGLPAQQIDNALYMIDHAAGARSDIVWGALERAVWVDQSTITPGFVALTGLEAVRACLRASEAEDQPATKVKANADGRRGDTLEACVAEALSLRVLSRAPLRSPAGR